MISQTAEYALRAVVFLADREGVPCTVSQIAETTKVPAGYLAKVMQMLSRARLVNSQRGINGGFSLAVDPSRLSLLEVINAVDPIRRFPECPLGIASHPLITAPPSRQMRRMRFSFMVCPPVRHASACYNSGPGTAFNTVVTSATGYSRCARPMQVP